MKKFRKLSLVTGLTFALVAALSVGMVFAWQYAKDQTPTTVVVTNAVPIREVILHMPPDGKLTTDPVSAIVVDTLRFCAFENLSDLGFDLHCESDPAGGIGIPILPTDPLEPVIEQVDGMVGPDLIVHFIPDTGLWRDVFPLGTTKACITGLVDNNDDGVGDEPLDGDLFFGTAPLCQRVVVLEGPARMTGGGNTRFGPFHVKKGLTLHCDITLANNLEINFGKGEKFHMTPEALIARPADDEHPNGHPICEDRDGFDPEPPDAPADTFNGRGFGRLNGVPGACVDFTFEDHGEPGKADEAEMIIYEDCANHADTFPGTPYRTFSQQVIDGGNLQFHFDQPHK